MSATATQSDGASFVESLTASPDLQETARERGLRTAAEQAGFDLTPEEIQKELKEAIEEDLPDNEVNEKDAIIACSFTMCSCA